MGTWVTQAQFRNFKVTSLDGKTLYEGLPPLPAGESGLRSALAVFRDGTRLRLRRTIRSTVSIVRRSSATARLAGWRNNRCASVPARPTAARSGLEASDQSRLVVRLVDGGNDRWRQQALPAPAAKWQEFPFELQPTASSTVPHLQIEVPGAAQPSGSIR